MLQASVQSEGTVRAIQESLSEIAGIRGSRRVTDGELALAVAALTRGYARNFETADQVARAVTQIALYDLPDDYFTRFVPTVTAVTVDDVTRVAAAHLDPARMTTLIVGDPERIGADLPVLQLGEAALLSADAC
jgi:predicted Zn-dependent peptidase